MTCVILPRDLQEEEYEAPPRAHGTIYSGGPPAPHVLPHDGDLARAADMLNAGERVAILIGQGARGAAAEVEQAAELLGAGVAKALNGRDVLPDDLPYVTGSIGLLGTKPSGVMMQGCDTLLMIGSGFPYSEWLPEPGQARGVQIDIDARMLGIRYPMELNLAGDARDTLQALLPLLRRKEDRSWQEAIGETERTGGACSRTGAAGRRPAQPGEGVPRAQRAAAGRLHRDRRLRLGHELVGPPPAIPSRHARRALRDARDDGPGAAVRGGREVRAPGPAGDRGRGRRRDADERHQRADRRRQVPRPLERSAPDRARAQQPRPEPGHVGAARARRRPEARGIPGHPDFPYARYAELLGLEGIRVDAPDQVAPAWEEALAADVPVVYEAVTDPEVPPLPPHIELEQAKKLASALARHDPAAGEIVRQALKGKAQELFNR